MSKIQRLNVSCIRNIQSALLEPSATINLLYGENGSGKTSVLESIHLLGTGRSFRSSKLDPLISHDDDEAIVYAELRGGLKIGLSKSRRRIHQLKLQNERQRNWESVARELPIQVLDSNSFLLLEGGPKPRRRFLDWGVFHVEHSFVNSWRRSRKAIANRNMLLKQARLDLAQLEAWDMELSTSADEVDAARRKYIDEFLPIFSQVYRSLGGANADELEITYERGWDSERQLTQVLTENRGVDCRYGATQNGPHRADLCLKLGKTNAVEILSRGQQKMLVSAMKIAQGKLLSQALDRQCIYLVDDLPSELDRANRAAVFDQLAGLGGQMFVTCVDLSAIVESLSNPPEMATFHVERGIITT